MFLPGKLIRKQPNGQTLMKVPSEFRQQSNGPIFVALLRIGSILWNCFYSVPIFVISGKRPYLSQMAENQRNKGTLISWTLKVGEDKVPSEFRFLAKWLRYRRFQNLYFFPRNGYNLYIFSDVSLWTHDNHFTAHALIPFLASYFQNKLLASNSSNLFNLKIHLI